MKLKSIPFDKQQSVQSALFIIDYMGHCTIENLQFNVHQLLFKGSE